MQVVPTQFFVNLLGENVDRFTPSSLRTVKIELIREKESSLFPHWSLWNHHFELERCEEIRGIWVFLFSFSLKLGLSNLAQVRRFLKEEGRGTPWCYEPYTVPIQSRHTVFLYLWRVAPNNGDVRKVTAEELLDRLPWEQVTSPLSVGGGALRKTVSPHKTRNNESILFGHISRGWLLFPWNSFTTSLAEMGIKKNWPGGPILICFIGPLIQRVVISTVPGRGRGNRRM